VTAQKEEPIQMGNVGEPPVGESLEESPEALRVAARPIAYGRRQITGLTRAEADKFVEALNEL
jgi:hypothetical protein